MRLFLSSSFIFAFPFSPSMTLLSLFFLPPKASLFPEPPLDHPLCRDSGRLSPYFSPHFVLPFTSSALFDHLSLYLYPFFRASPFVPLFFFLRKKGFPTLSLSFLASVYMLIPCLLRNRTFSSPFRFFPHYNLLLFSSFCQSLSSFS